MTQPARKTTKTPTQQKAKIGNIHPAGTTGLDLDESGPTHPKAGQTKCGAIRWYNGAHVTCTLKAGHPGDHEETNGPWRRRSGDA